MTTSMSRRSMIAGAAALPAAAVLPAVALAAEPDPIFAAIKEFRRADERHVAAITRMGHVDEKIFQKRKEAQALVDAADPTAKEWADAKGCFAQQVGRPVTDDELKKLAVHIFSEDKALEAERMAASEAQSDACDESCDASTALAATVPTTIRGAIALLDLFREEEEKGNSLYTITDEDGIETWEILMDTLGTFLRRHDGLPAEA